MEYRVIFGVLWASMCAMIAVRAIARSRVKSLVSKRPAKEAFLLLLAVTGMALLPLAYLATDWLGPFSFTLPPDFRFLGALIYSIGLLLLFWVHHALGRGWSPLLEISRGQVLVTEGPYLLVRHPLYLAFYIIAIGQFLLTANWAVGAGALVLWTLFYAGRVRDEEQLMLSFFGREYEEYMERTGRLLPKLKS